jgi:hypothetical protein
MWASDRCLLLQAVRRRPHRGWITLCTGQNNFRPCHSHSRRPFPVCPPVGGCGGQPLGVGAPGAASLRRVGNNIHNYPDSVGFIHRNGRGCPQAGERARRAPGEVPAERRGAGLAGLDCVWEGKASTRVPRMPDESPERERSLSVAGAGRTGCPSPGPHRTRQEMIPRPPDENPCAAPYPGATPDAWCRCGFLLFVRHS